MSITLEQLEQLHCLVGRKIVSGNPKEKKYQELVRAFNCSTDEHLAQVSFALWGDSYVNGQTILVRQMLIAIIREQIAKR